MGNQSPTSPQALPHFEPGELCYTPNALAVLQRYQVNPFDLINRHLRGDWGDVCAEDAQANNEALKVGARLFSSYELPPIAAEGETLPSAKVWIITEADRSGTIILLPEDY